MLYLLSASIIWSFSFGLIKGNLTSLHPNLVSFFRIAISLLVFLPFIKVKNIPNRFKLKLVLIGGVQYGLMYITYIYSYKYLKGYEAALFTIFTPSMFRSFTISQKEISQELFDHITSGSCWDGYNCI